MVQSDDTMLRGVSPWIQSNRTGRGGPDTAHVKLTAVPRAASTVLGVIATVWSGGVVPGAVRVIAMRGGKVQLCAMMRERQQCSQSLEAHKRSYHRDMTV